MDPSDLDLELDLDPGPARPGYPPLLLVAAGLCALLGLALFPMGLLPPIAPDATFVAPQGVLQVVLTHVLLATGFVVAAPGLVARRPWGWWCGVLFSVGALLTQGKMLLFYLAALNWDHPRAVALGAQVGLRYGLPCLVSLAVLVLLALPSLREVLGVRQRPYRRRRPVGPRGPRP